MLTVDTHTCNLCREHFLLACFPWMFLSLRSTFLVCLIDLIPCISSHASPLRAVTSSSERALLTGSVYLDKGDAKGHAFWDVIDANRNPTALTDNSDTKWCVSLKLSFWEVPSHFLLLGTNELPPLSRISALYVPATLWGGGSQPARGTHRDRDLYNFYYNTFIMTVLIYSKLLLMPSLV